MPDQGKIPYMDATEGTLQVDRTVPHPLVRSNECAPILLPASHPRPQGWTYQSYAQLLFASRLFTMEPTPSSNTGTFPRPVCVAPGDSGL